MLKYIYNGQEYTEEEVAKAAANLLMTVDDYINEYKLEIVEATEEQQVEEDFQQAPQEETAFVGPQTEQQAVEEVLPSVDTSLGLSEIEDEKWTPESFGVSSRDIQPEVEIDVTVEDPEKQKEEKPLVKRLKDQQKAFDDAKHKKHDFAKKYNIELHNVWRYESGKKIIAEIAAAEAAMDANNLEENVIAYLQEAAPGLNISESGFMFGNALTYTDPITKERREIDLKPLRGDPTFVQKQLIDLVESYDVLTSSEKALNAVSQLFDPNKSINIRLDKAINETLEPSGYSVQFEKDPEQRDSAGQLINNYAVYKDGKELKVFNSKAEAANFIKENLTPEELGRIKDASYDAVSNYVKNIESEKGSALLDFEDKEKQSKILKDYYQNTYYDNFVEIVKKTKSFTEEELKEIEVYFEQQKKLREEYEGGNYYGTTELRKDKPASEFISITKDLSGLSDELKVKLIESGALQGVVDSDNENLSFEKKNYIDTRVNTFAEKTIINEGINPKQLQIATDFSNISDEQFIEEYKETKKALLSLAENQEKILDDQLKSIFANAPEGTDISFQDVNEINVLSITNERNLTGEEAKSFERAKLKVIDLQNTYNALRADQRQANQNLEDRRIAYMSSRLSSTDAVDVETLGRKNYKFTDVLAKDFYDASASIALAVPTLVGSESAIQYQRQLNEKNTRFETMLAFDEVEGFSGGLRFGLRTGAQQLPNVALAIGTSGLGSSIGLSTALISSYVATGFGVSSGTQKYRDLTISQDIVKTAREQLKTLETAYKEGLIPIEQYTAYSLDLNKVVASNELSGNQIVGASIATGLVEGTVTRFLGTVPNSISFIKNVSGKGGKINLANFIRMNNLEKFGFAGKQIGLSTLGEIAEEETIYFGDTILSEGLILGRDMDFSQWDDTLVTALITAGPMNGSGVAYSSILANTQTKAFNKLTNELIKDIADASKGIALATNQSDKDLLYAIIAQKTEDQFQAISGLEVDAIGLGAENLKNLINYGIMLDGIYSKAGITKADSDQVVQEKIENHISNLKKQGEENQAEAFEDQLNLVKKQIDQVKSPENIDYKTVEDALGENGAMIAQDFKENNTDGYNGKSRKMQLAQVINQVRQKVVQESINRAKNNPSIVKSVQDTLLQLDENYTTEQEDALYEMYGKQMVLNRAKATSYSLTTEANANEILRKPGQVENLQIIEETDLTSLNKRLEVMLNNGDISLEQANEIRSNFNGKNYGFIVGDQYIVKNKQAADERLADGKLLQGTMILHEFSHAIDNRAFTAEELAVYSTNLHSAISNSKNKDLQSIGLMAENILAGIDTYKEEGAKSFNERSQNYKDEYTKLVQETLYAKNNKLDLEAQESIFKKLTTTLGIGLDINTPEKALEYTLAYNHAFRNGSLSSIALARIKRSKPSDINQGISNSEISRVQSEYDALFENFENGDITEEDLTAKLKSLNAKADKARKEQSLPALKPKLNKLEAQELDDKNIADLKKFKDPNSTETQKNKAIESILKNNPIIYKALGYSAGKGDITIDEINSEIILYLKGNKGLPEKNKGRYGRGILNTYDNTKDKKISSYLSERFGYIKQGLYQDILGTNKDSQTVSIDSENVKELMADEETYGNESISSEIVATIDPFNLFLTMDENGKMVQDQVFRDNFKAALKEKLSKLTPEQLEKLDYKELYKSNIVPLQVLADWFGIEVNRLSEPQRNLQKKDPVKPIQRWILNNADTLIRIMQKGNTEVGNIGTNISSRVLQNAFYDKQPKKINNQIQYKLKPRIKRADYLELHGVLGSKTDPTFVPYRDQQSQAIKGTLEMTGRNLTSLIGREIIEDFKAEGKLTNQQALRATTSLASGKRDLMFSEISNNDGENSSGVKTVKLEKSEVKNLQDKIASFAEAYANSNFNFNDAYEKVYGEDFGNKAFIVKGWMGGIISRSKNIGKKDTQTIEQYLNDKLFNKVNEESGVMLVSGVAMKYKNDDGTYTELGERVREVLVGDDSELAVALTNAKTAEEKIQLVEDFYNDWGYILKAKQKLVKNNTELFNNFLKPLLDKNKIKYKIVTTKGIIQHTKTKLINYKSEEPVIIVNNFFQKRTKSAEGYQRTYIGQLNRNKNVSKKPFVSFSKPMDPTVDKQKRNAINELKSWDAQAEKYLNIIKKQIEFVNKLDDMAFATAFLDLSLNDMKSPLKLFPRIKYIEKNILGKITYEHTLPSSYLARNLMSYFLGDTSLDVVNKVLESSYVSLVSSETNRKLNKNYSNTMPVNYKPGEDPVIRMTESGVDVSKDLTNVVNPEKPMSSLSEISNLSETFNGFIEDVTDIPADKVYSVVAAELSGKSRGKHEYFIPPSAEDLMGLLYKTLNKGRDGDLQKAWYDLHITKPYARAMTQVSNDRVYTIKRYNDLKKQLGIIPKNLKKKIEGDNFTYEQAVRVYAWIQQGYDIPGLSIKEKVKLRSIVKNDPVLKAFADQLIDVNGGFDYTKPKNGWIAGTITTDLLESLNTTKRAEYLKNWQKNVDEIFSENNLNKLQAAYGSEYRYAMENILTRMKTGRNRTHGNDRLTGRIEDWLTNSVGAIMFLNTRSAVLQTLSAINFINWEDNNPLMAAKAFANQPQYWRDFIMLFNSSFLVDRRQGLRLEVNEADLAELAKENGVQGVIGRILKLGFTPTQLADSFAIAAGGSTFYRNRLNRYIKEGVDPAIAEEMAFREFRETAEESQQSSRPDRISAQQASSVGKYILAFANTPAQYARLMKKAALDLKNGRGDTKTNISKIMYYGFVQNLLFNTLQGALEALMFDDEDEEELTPEEKETAKIKKERDRLIKVSNGMLDSVLRGTGIFGALVSVIKNVGLRAMKEAEKDYPEYAEALTDEMFKISPPISAKYQNIKNGLRSYDYDKDVMVEMGYNIDNPAYMAGADIVTGITNLPVDRLLNKMYNVRAAINEDLKSAQRIALLSGWSKYNLGIKDDKIEKIKEELKTRRADAKKEEARKIKLERNRTLQGLTPEERASFLIKENQEKIKNETKAQKKKRIKNEERTRILRSLTPEERAIFIAKENN